MREKLDDGTISKEQMDKVIALDNMLTEKGLQTYMQVGKTLRAELGYGTVESKSSGSKKTSRKSTGRKSSKAKKKSFSIPSGFSLVPGGGSGAGSVANLIRNSTP
jgi:hypothetical protein